jgi:NhaP-type Na+/H+ or K+/H+ antiporter
MSWFGPKGVGTMTFSLLVLAEQITAGERIFNLAALVVFCSIIAHGLTEQPGIDWLERHTARDRDEANGARRDATGPGSSQEGSRPAQTQ